MPFTGGASPSPERYGGGVGNTSVPLLQRIYEGIAAARGSAYDQSWPPTTAVGIENMAMARAICFDGYGANERLANNVMPGTATPEGCLGRWENILGLVVQPTDTPPLRRARLVAAFASFGKASTLQRVRDACSALLGSVFVALVLADPSNAMNFWPGFTGSAGLVSSLGPGSTAVITGMAGVTGASYGSNLVCSGAPNAGNNGTFPITAVNSPSSVTILNPTAHAGDTITWQVVNPLAPWESSIAHVDAHVDPSQAGFHNADGTPNAIFYNLMGQLGTLLDEIMPAWATFDWYINSSHGGQGWYLDEPDLDLEVFDV